MSAKAPIAIDTSPFFYGPKDSFHSFDEVRLQISFYGLWVCDIWQVNYVLAVEGDKHDTEKK
jgi:hypothetical protein